MWSRSPLTFIGRSWNFFVLEPDYGLLSYLTALTVLRFFSKRANMKQSVNTTATIRKQRINCTTGFSKKVYSFFTGKSFSGKREFWHSQVAPTLFSFSSRSQINRSVFSQLFCIYFLWFAWIAMHIPSLGLEGPIQKSEPPYRLAYLFTASCDYSSRIRAKVPPHCSHVFYAIEKVRLTGQSM